MTRIDVKSLAADIKNKVSKQVEELKKDGVHPKLTVISVGDSPASKVYVAGKQRDCEECGIISDAISLPENIDCDEFIKTIEMCNIDDSIHGILIQMPLPSHFDNLKVVEAISPLKDVDCFSPINVGKMFVGEDCLLPCTPAGCLEILKSLDIDIADKRAVVLGRSNIVGKPMAMILLREDATITVCHSLTENIEEITIKADIIVAAIGKAGFLHKGMVKDGAVVIDVGINRDADGKLCGDADEESLKDVEGFITPVPGGVGLITRAMLLHNTSKAAIWSLNKDD